MVKVKGANTLLGTFVHKVPPPVRSPRSDLHDSVLTCSPTMKPGYLHAQGRL